MLPIKLNGQPFNFPTEVSELTLKQFFALRKSKGILDEICALTGIDRQTIANFKGREDIITCQALLTDLGKKLSEGFDTQSIPKEVTIAGKPVTVPKNLKLEPIGAFISVHNLITEQQQRAAAAETGFDPTDIIPQVLAHYFWLPYMGDDVLYSEEKVENEAYLEQIMGIPFTEAVPIANFFFEGIRTYDRAGATIAPPLNPA